MEEPLARRPLKSRQTRWAAAIAGFLARIGMRPNAISLLSVVFAAAASGALTFAAFVPGRLHLVLLLALAAACVQLRLLCNLLDGMVAVEGGFRTKVGELYNEFPDRVADVLILTGAGAFAGPVGLWLGALAALLAVLTA